MLENKQGSTTYDATTIVAYVAFGAQFLFIRKAARPVVTAVLNNKPRVVQLKDTWFACDDGIAISRIAALSCM